MDINNQNSLNSCVTTAEERKLIISEYLLIGFSPSDLTDDRLWLRPFSEDEVWNAILFLGNLPKENRREIVLNLRRKKIGRAHV